MAPFTDGTSRSQPPSLPPDDDPEKVPLALRLVPSVIEGLTLHHDFVTEDEESVMLKTIDAQPWDVTIRRRTQHYGRRFDYHKKTVGDDATPLPEDLRIPLVQRLCTAQPALVPWLNADASCIQCTINEYVPGIGIASHVDTHSAFEDGIASLTLGGGCAFRLQRASDGADLSIWLPPRSLLILRGAARYQWKHSISGRKFDRVELAASCAVPTPSVEALNDDERSREERSREERSREERSREERSREERWKWYTRVRRVSVTVRRVLETEKQCTCSWPELCDGRPAGTALMLPTRLPPPSASSPPSQPPPSSSLSQPPPSSPPSQPPPSSTSSPSSQSPQSQSPQSRGQPAAPAAPIAQPFTDGPTDKAEEADEADEADEPKADGPYEADEADEPLADGPYEADEADEPKADGPYEADEADEPLADGPYEADGVGDVRTLVSDRERAVASCLGPLVSLEKRGYQWSQTAGQVRVVLSLGSVARATAPATAPCMKAPATAPGAPPAVTAPVTAPGAPPAVEACEFSETSCRLRVVALSSTGSLQRLFFDVGALYRAIDPSRSQCVLSKQRARVTLVLAKREAGCEWVRLRA
jgi:alkylated DNA repair dioxygenase AlkB